MFRYHVSISRLVILVSCALINAVAWEWFNRPQALSLSFNESLPSVSFSPYRRGQSPLTQVYPSLEQIDADLRSLVGIARGVRTYTSLEGLEEVPRLALKYGLQVTQGAWLTMEHKLDGTPSGNEIEIASLIRTANAYPDTVSRVVVGNEVLLRGELTSDQLISYIRRVKAAVKQPVTYADVWAFFLKYPEVVNEIDFLTIHILPYWEDEPVAIEAAVQHVVRIYQIVAQRFPGKPILIGEVGWPTAGRARGSAVPNRLNSAQFLRAVMRVAKAQGFDYNWIEAFDQPWKSGLEGTVGANWGILDEQRDSKFALSGTIIPNPHWIASAIGAAILGLISGFWYLQRRDFQSLWHMVLIAAFAQFLGSLVAAQALYVWSISYSVNQQFWALLRISIHALYAGVLLTAIATSIQRQQLSVTVVNWGQILVMLYAVVAIYATSMLLLDGRYRDIPIQEFLIPCLGLLGYALLRWIGGGGFAIQCLFNSYGNGIQIPAKWTGLWLLIAAGIAPISEVLALSRGDDFIHLHPILSERLPLLMQALWSNTEMLTWSAMLSIMALPFLAQWRIDSKASTSSLCV